MAVRVLEGSVLEAAADAIVNAANTELVHGGGVAAAIARAAGPELEEESRRVAPCPIGQAVATTAGRLRAKGIQWVIHVPTVDYPNHRRATAADITAGTAAALRLAKSLGCRRLAFPLLGAGVAGLGAEEAASAMARAFAEEPEIEIIVAAFSERDRAAVRSVFKDAAEAEKAT